MTTMITKLPDDIPYDELIQLCMDIRLGKVQASPEVRQRAKSITFALTYGASPKKFEKFK